MAEDKWVRLRVSSDLLVKESSMLDPFQMEELARNTSNYQSTVGKDQLLSDSDINATRPHFTAHVHDASGGYCVGCASMAEDDLS